MNSLLFCVSTFFWTPGEDSLCREKFYERAVKDTVGFGPVTKVEMVDSSGGRKAVLWTCGRVYRRMKGDGASYETYKFFLKDLLAQNRPITPEEFLRFGGNIVPTDRYVNRIAKKGRKKFIKHFFVNRGTFNFQKYDDHQMAVIAKMYDFGVLLDWVEGNLAIIYTADCQR